MQDGPKVYGRVNNLLHFCDLLEDDRSKISHTKVMAWLAGVTNVLNMVYQFFQTHPDATMVIGTNIGHAIAAMKHEFKRRNS